MSAAVRLADGSWYGLTADAGRFGQRVTARRYAVTGGPSVVGPAETEPRARFGSVDDAATVAVIAARSVRLWLHVQRSTVGPAMQRAADLVGRFGRDRAAAVRYLDTVGASVPTDED